MSDTNVLIGSPADIGTGAYLYSTNGQLLQTFQSPDPGYRYTLGASDIGNPRVTTFVDSTHGLNQPGEMAFDAAGNL